MRAHQGHSRVLTTLGLTVIGLAAVVVPSAGAALAHRPATPVDSQPANTWTKFGYNAQNNEVSPDPLISDTNASTLGVKYMVNTEHPVLASPVTAWDPTLSETLVYTGNEGGYFTAYDAANGNVVWSDNLGSAIKETALVEGGNVWVAPTYGGKFYKLNATTGATECTAAFASYDYASPVLGTPNGGAPSVFLGLNAQGTVSGPVYAYNESNCATEWEFTGYKVPSGVWDPLSFFQNGTSGTSMLLFGTADPDESAYALNAETGAEIWRFQTPGTGDDDVGAGVDISSPGVNGFADGVAYFPGKDGYVYAVNLMTGRQIWSKRFLVDKTGVLGSISTPALVGNQLIFGSAPGEVFSLNATTGATDWVYKDGGTPIDSGITVVGPVGDQVATFTTLGGQFQVITVSNGILLYSYQTGNYATASPADVDGNLFVSSSDGFLYDFALGGGAAASPTTTVTTPASGDTVPNPNGTLTISGTASDANGVAGVNVAIQEDGETGSWWNAALGEWTAGTANDPATVASPGATSTTWSVAVAPPARGTEITVLASAVDPDGVADVSADATPPSPARETFTVLPSTTAPLVTTTVSRVPPGTKVVASASGFKGGETVDFSLPTNPPTALGSAKASAKGLVKAASLTIPSTMAFGPTSLVATGVTSGDVTSMALYISNNWSQYGYGPTHTAYEPNDQVITKHVTITSNSFLVQAWSYPSSGSIESSPTVDGGVAYFGNNAGDVSAVDVLTGAPEWVTSLGTGNPIDSTPAVVDGLVIVGTESGDLVALNASTGSTAWTTTMAGPVESSPAAVGSTVYVGTDAGTLAALNATTGQLLWSTTVGGEVISSPAVDATAQLAVVGSTNDTVTAVSTATGDVVWSYTTGGSVTASPLIDSGKVFIGSADGNEYALTESTGATSWSFALGGAVADSAALDVSDIVVGSNAGTIYFLSRATGAVDHSTPTKGEVVGVSYVSGVAMAELSNGNILAMRPNAGYLNWKFSSGATLDSVPTIVNGVVYVTSEDDCLYAFAVQGAGLE